jgi:hypothetical protein
MSDEGMAVSADWSMRALRGSELERYIGDSSVQTALEAKLAPGGSEDISQRIRSFYGIPKNLPASYIARFVQLARLTGDARSFVSILAPHTHWSYSRPILYKYCASQDRYIVGLHEVNPEEWYRPVSFIAHNRCVFAYEWLDESVPLDDLVWERAVQKIHSILRDSVTDEEPISLGVDFRFREDTGRENSHSESGSVEFPVNIRSANKQEFSLIVRGAVAQEIDFGSRESLAVGWPCRSIGYYDLSPEQARLLDAIKAMLTNIPQKEDRVIAAGALLDQMYGRISD